MKLIGIKHILSKKKQKTQRNTPSANTMILGKPNAADRKGPQSYFMTDKELREFKKRYTDPVPDQNIILGEDVMISTDTMKTLRNLNTLVIGGSGTGKSYHFIRPNIAQMNGSMVITDPSGEMLRGEGKKLLENGYKLKVFSTADPKHSNCYNPMDYLYDHESGKPDELAIVQLADLIHSNADKTGSREGDPFWTTSMSVLLRFLLAYVIEFYPEEDRDLYHVLRFAQSLKPEADVLTKSPIALLAKDIKETKPDALCLKYYDVFSLAPGKTALSILISVNVVLDKFHVTDIRNLTSTAYECNYTTDGDFIAYVKDKNGRLIRTTENIDLEKLGDEKTALFICQPVANDAYNLLTAMLVSQAIHILYNRAEKYSMGRYAIYDSKGEALSSQYSSEEEAQYVKKLYQDAKIRKISADGHESDFSLEEADSEPIKSDDRYYIYNQGAPYEYSLRGHWNGYLKEVYSAKTGKELIRKYREYTSVKKQGYGLPVHVTFMLDEFCNIGCIPSIEHIMSTSRKEGISFNLILQCIAQLKHLYAQKWEQIIVNCDSIVFLGISDTETSGFVFKILEKKDTVRLNTTLPVQTNHKTTEGSFMTLEQISHLDAGREIVIIRAEKPFICKKYDYSKHPLYDADNILSEEYISSVFICTPKHCKGTMVHKLSEKADKVSEEKENEPKQDNLCTKKSDNLHLFITGCTDDECTEPTKVIAGWGTRILSPEDVAKGIKKHVNLYSCDNINCPRHLQCQKRCD